VEGEVADITMIGVISVFGGNGTVEAAGVRLGCVMERPTVRAMRYAVTSSIVKNTTGAMTSADNVLNSTGSHSIEGLRMKSR